MFIYWIKSQEIILFQVCSTKDWGSIRLHCNKKKSVDRQYDFRTFTDLFFKSKQRDFKNVSKSKDLRISVKNKADFPFSLNMWNSFLLLRCKRKKKSGNCIGKMRKFFSTTYNTNKKYKIIYKVLAKTTI